MFMFKLWLKEKTEMIQIKIAWALPHKIVMWAGIRLIANATQGEHGTDHPDDVSVLQALSRW
jgi:hypothetical protein